MKLDEITFRKLENDTIACDVPYGAVELLMPALEYLRDNARDAVTTVTYTAEIRLVLTRVVCDDGQELELASVRTLGNLLGMVSA